MTVGVATIAERALRRLGVAIVPVADRPALTSTLPPATIATNALVELGLLATGQAPPSATDLVTTDSIAIAALTKLGVIAADETPASSDMTLAQGAVTHVHDNLTAQALASWSVGAIPAAVAEEYAALAAAHLASSFGKQADPQMAPLLEGRIGTVSRLIEAQAQALAKLQQVQASLTSQALVSWPDSGVPAAVAEEYTQLTAMALAPGFGKQMDPQMLPVLEARVRRMAQILAAPESANAVVMAVHNNLTARGLARWTVFDLPAAAELPYELLAANRLAPLYDKQFDANAELLGLRALAQIIALQTSGERTVAEYF